MGREAPIVRLSQNLHITFADERGHGFHFWLQELGERPALQVQSQIWMWPALVDPDQRRDLVSPSIIGVAGRNTRDVSYAKQGDHRC